MMLAILVTLISGAADDGKLVTSGTDDTNDANDTNDSFHEKDGNKLNNDYNNEDQ